MLKCTEEREKRKRKQVYQALGRKKVIKNKTEHSIEGRGKPIQKYTKLHKPYQNQKDTKTCICQNLPEANPRKH